MNRLRKFLTASVLSATLLTMCGISFASAAAIDGDVIKMNGNSSVYYMKGGKRFVFPNQATYSSWYSDANGGPDWDIVKVVSQSELESYPLGGNVTVRPGTKLVKITTNPTVYAVEPGGTLRAISSEAAAIEIWGANWAKNVIDVADSFFVNYKTGTALTAGTYPAGTVVSPSGTFDLYYFDGTGYRKFSNEAAFINNGFNSNFVVTTTKTIVAAGTPITGAEAGLMDTSGGATTGGGAVVVGGTGVTVALASDTPASANLPMGATNITALKFNVTAAADGDMTISSIKVKRSGIGNINEIAGVMIYDGTTRLTSARTLASDTNAAELTLNYLVPKGTTKNLSVVINTSSSVGGGNHSFSIDSAADVKTTTGSVSGTFPISGNAMNVSGTVLASTVTVDQVSTAWTTKIGSTDTEIAKFFVQAGSNDASVRTITLRNGGTLSNSNLSNFKLYVGGTVVATAASMTGDKVVLNLTTPYLVTKGQTKNFSLTGDIKGGRTGDLIKFYADETSDLMINDNTYNVGATITNNYALGNQIVTMEGADVTMIDNGPSASTYAVNTTNKSLLAYSVSAQRNITVKKTKITIDFGGAFQAGDFAKIKNIRLVDTATGSSVAGPITDLSSTGWKNVGGTTCVFGDGYCYYISNDTYDIAAGTTRKLAVQADFDNTLTSGSTFIAAVDLTGDGYIYDNDSAEYVAAAKIVPGALTGKTMTVNAAGLDITKAATPASQTFVKGSTLDALGVSLNVATSDSLKLNKMTARIYADATAGGATFDNSGYGDTAANTVVESASLYNGTTLVKGPVTLSAVGTIGQSGGYYKADFTNLGFAMPAGSSNKLTIQLKLRNTFTGTKYVAVDVDKADLEVENSAGNLLSIGSANLNLAGSPSPVITAKQNGTLTVAVDGNTTPADVIVTGVAGQEVTKYRFTATDEAFDIVGLKLTNSGSDAAISKVTLAYTDATGVAVTKEGYMSGNVLTFADGQVGIRVPKDGNAVLTIKADVNTISGGATSNTKIQLGLTKSSAQWANSANNLTDDFIVLGASSGQKLYGNTNSLTVNNSNVKEMTIAKTKVTLVNNLVDGNSTVSANNLIGVYRFTSAAETGSNQNSVLASTTVQLSGSMVTATGTIAVRFYNSSTFDSNHLMGTGTLTTTANGSTDAVQVNFTANNEFNGVQDVYVVVDSTDVNLTPAGTGTKSLSSTLTTYTWNDGTTAGAFTTPVSGVPVTGSTRNYSF